MKCTIVYISHCNSSEFGGADYSLVNLVKALDSRKYDAIVIARSRSARNKYKEYGIESLYVPFKLNLMSQNKLIGKLFFIPRLIRDCITNIICLEICKKKISSKKVAIIHSNSSVFTFGYDLAKKMKVKHVWHIREFQDIDFGMKPFRGWNNLKYKIYDSDYVIAITKAIFKHWELNNCKQSSVLYNAIRSKNDTCYNVNKNKSVLCCSLNLSDAKGTDVAVSMFCKSGIYKSGYRLILIGGYDSAYKSKLLKITDKYQQTEFVKFLGYQDDIRQYMVSASAFLMCSKFEALGRVTVEAMFYGCPVLGHNTGGTKEIIIDGFNGYLYDNLEEGVAKLKLLLEDNNNTIEMINNAQSITLNNFTVENYSDSIDSIYNKFLEDKQ